MTFFPEVDPDLALEAFREECDLGERCPSCRLRPTPAFPIIAAVDLWGTHLYRCSACAHEWADVYGSHQR